MFLKNRIIKLCLIISAIYFGLRLFDQYYLTQDDKILEKTILLTILITFVNFMYPTL